MANEDFQAIYDYIENTTGIRVNQSHKVYLDSWIESNLNQFKYTVEEYLALVQRDEMENSALIDEAAINETYFFREELQFSYLQDMIFSQHVGETMHLWSAASSTGEEALSLYALGKKCGVHVQITASDIDQNALAFLRKGEYGSHSFRRNENHYLPLIEELGEYSADGTVRLKVSDECRSHITAVMYNLVGDMALPVPDESVDIIFLRNVFIYFSSQNQLKVLQKVSKALKPGGLLFLSINEIAGVDCPDSLPLIKEHFQSVYYMRKVTAREKQELSAKSRRRGSAVNVPPNDKKTAPDLEELPVVVQPSSVPAALRQPVEAPVIRTSAEPSVSSVISTSSVSDSRPEAQMTIEQLWRTVADCIEKRDFSGGRQVLSVYRFKATQLEYQYYYLGMIAVEEGDYASAKEYLFKATAANHKFWPAYFQLGMTCQKMQNGKGAEDAFDKCRTLLKKPELADNAMYTFLTEGFCPAYFLNLCNSLLRN